VATSEYVYITSWKKCAFRLRIVQFDTTVYTKSIRKNSQVRCVQVKRVHITLHSETYLILSRHNTAKTEEILPSYTDVCAGQRGAHESDYMSHCKLHEAYSLLTKSSVFVGNCLITQD